MVARFKKFFLALVAVALGAMSSGAMATSYNFTYFGDNGYSVVGVFIVDDIVNLITDISGTVTQNTILSNITGLLPVGTFNQTSNLYSSVAPYVDTEGVSFSTAGDSFNLWSDMVSIYYLCSGMGNCPDQLADSTGTMTSAAVPEINGALIPQVGFLIACLFLILGRRKENTEPIPLFKLTHS